MGYEAYAQGGEYRQQGGEYGQAGGYGQASGYGQGDGYGYSGDGYGQGDGYERNDGYGPSAGPGPGSGQYGSGEYEYRANGGYGQDYEYGQEHGYGQGEYGAGHGYDEQQGYGQQGYGQQGYGQGAPGYGDDGNDWYGNQAPLTGGFAAVRDPVRGFPPAPGQFAPRPQLPAAPQLSAAPQLPAAPRQLEAAPYTGQHEVYDESRYEVHTGQHQAYDDSRYEVYTGQHQVYDDGQYETYPGYEGVTEAGEPQGYDAPQGYGGAPGYNSTQTYETTGYGTAAYDTGQAEPQAFAAAPTYEDAVGYAPQGYDDYDDYDDPNRYGDGNRDGGTLAPGPEDGRPGKAPKGGKRRVSRRALLSVAGVVMLVAAAAGAGYTFILKPKSSANNDSVTGPLPSPNATSSVTAACRAQLGEYCHIELRTDDPKPLTLAELYPPQFFNETDHVSFTQVGTRLDKNCANAVIGPDLVSALQSGNCTQVLRASYVSGDQKIMGTIGVVNLNTTNEAHHAGKVVGGNDFVSPLSAAHGLGSNIGKGTGVVQAEFKGHYLILTWAEFSNLKGPANTAQDTALEQFQNDLIAGTANISLSQRMVNGTPATTSGS